MRIGIVSDSHGKWKSLARALVALTGEGAETIVHCGDIGNVECLLALARAEVPTWAVAGNMDRNVRPLADAAVEAGVRFHHDTVEVPLSDGRFLVAIHGHREWLLVKLLASGQFPYVCHGHTHVRRDEHIGPVHVINPGALCHAHPRSVALLDTETDQVTFMCDF
ncbi:MAG: YfcE family phosphodiesterase [Planctomycetes bacterium]|nr:YfcE family phosphodiesterase [Planctomycetota bacterium]